MALFELYLKRDGNQLSETNSGIGWKSLDLKLDCLGESDEKMFQKFEEEVLNRSASS